MRPASVGGFPPLCTEGWWPYAGHCYSIQRESKAWKDALFSCKSQDGDLASVHSIAEYSFLVKSFSFHASEPTEELWLGLNDLKAHFYFEWSDGTPVTFTTWQCRHPTYRNGLEDCVVMKGQVKLCSHFIEMQTNNCLRLKSCAAIYLFRSLFYLILETNLASIR
uniref:C-type lectin domain-containing protein n=1 Tax=Pavo cristatus TaxID=9049 RepID=A0A8C9G1V6_PAVCR